MEPFSFTTVEPPVDFAAHVRTMKKELRAFIGDVSARFDSVCRFIEREVREIERLRERGLEVWPVIPFADIENGNVGDAVICQVRRRGCAVVKGHFDKAQALGWDRQLVEYLQKNDFDRVYRGPGDNFFGSLQASRPEIFPIYWSRPQMEARQHERMARVQSFLNRLWKFDSDGITWFDPDRNTLYPDRVRRRPPGTTSKGLGAHTDSGALERWLNPAYQKVFEKVYSGEFADFDPWYAAHRTEVSEYPLGSTKCSAFRTFQGWTALSDMRHDQGVLHTVPIPEAMAYILLRPFLVDVPENELCGVSPGKVLPVSERWHPLLTRALSGIPDVEAGDTVWWHCDLIHAVAPVENQQGWGNVMYIPAAPACEKNLHYATRVAAAFSAGKSPEDFPAEHYETDWIDRFAEKDLNDIGRRSLGL